MTRPSELGAAAAAGAIAAGSLSAAELAEDCLARIAEREDTVGAFAWLEPDLVRRQAQALDTRASPRGLLHGIPLGIKDIMDTVDMPTGRGSPIYAGYRPVADASCVALARAAGAVIAGKTVTTEFAYFHPGRTRNPRDPAHTPGGSSMGSAAAVADCMLPLAFGTQTAGSVTRPAAYCGVIGYKASHGDIDLQGVLGLAPSLDTFGCFCRDLRDILLLRTAVLGDGFDAAPRRHPPRVGFVRTRYWEDADAATRTLLERVAATLDAAGAQVDEPVLPPDFDELVQLQKCIMAHETARARAFEYDAHRDQLSEQFRTLVESGQSVDYDDYRAAQTRARAVRGAMDGLLQDYDLLLAPSAPGEAPTGEATGDPLFNRMWTLLHTPTVTLPAGRGANALPLGIQLIGRIGADTRLVVDAEWVQAQLG